MKRLVAILLLILPFGAKANDPSIYGGLELQVRDMGVRDGNIGVFSPAALQPNILAGVKVHENVSLEAGANICRFTHKSKNFHKSNAVHLGAIGHYPLSNKVTLLGGLGAARVSATYHNAAKLKQSKLKKVVPRGLVGLQYSILDGLDIRASVAHEKTKKLKDSFVRSKDSTSYSLGVIKTF
jgi:hypothetical protein